MYKHINSFGLVVAMLLSANTFAADHQIAMLDKDSKSNMMVFDPPFLAVNVGDTISFVAKSPGHNIISRLVPEGAPDFKGEVNKNFTLKLDKEGLYIYECDLHVMLGMVGMIQVGKATNIDAAIASAEKLKKKMAMSSERLDEYLSMAH